jgi:hypothetical protein
MLYSQGQSHHPPGSSKFLSHIHGISIMRIYRCSIPEAEVRYLERKFAQLEKEKVSKDSLDTLPAVGGEDAVDAVRDVKLKGFPEISEGKITETGDLFASGHSIALQKKLLVDGDEQIFLSHLNRDSRIVDRQMA